MAEVDPYREHILAEVRSIGGQWWHLHLLQNGASIATMRKVEEKLEELGVPVGPMSDARAWRLTIEIIMNHVDRDLRVPNAAKAMLARLVLGAKWQAISEEMHRPIKSCKDIVTRATARFYAEIVARGITDDYKAAA
jgi:hypothetical protein